MYSCTCEGQPLVEVFGVRFHGGEAPAGTVSVFDGKRGQIVYNGGPVHAPSSRPTQRSGGGLLLTGPYRAISADGCVSIVLDLHHSRDDNASAISSSSSTSYVSEILLDVYDENTKYDEAITYDDGQAAVTYALLSDAAEAVVEVSLLRERPTSSTAVVRKVVARTRLGEVVLFDDNEGVNVSTGTEEQPAGVVVVPLARSVVAVPLASSLTLVVDLVVGDHDGEEVVVTESLLCKPKVRGEEVCRGSIVEVKVTWLD